MSSIFKYSFILYFLGISIFARDFAKIVLVNIGVPFLPTEAMILIWLLYKIYYRHNKIFVDKGALKFCLAFVLYTLFIFMISPFSLYSIRQLMPYLYVIFIFITIDFLTLNQNVLSLIKLSKFSFYILFILTIINTYIFTFGTITETSTQGLKYTYIGNYGVVFIVYFYSLREFLNDNKKEIFTLSLVLIWLLFFGLHRSAILSIIVPLLFSKEFLLKGRKILRIFLMFLIIAGIIYSFYNLFGKEQANIESIFYRISTILRPHDDYNSAWRINYWNTIVDFLTNSIPEFIFGYGFGLTSLEKSFMDYSNNTLLTSGVKFFHNSYLYILLKTGVIGLLIFLGIITKPLLESYKTNSHTFKIIWGYSLFAMIVYAGFNVVFENPYYGFFIWLPIGVIYYENKYEVRS